MKGVSIIIPCYNREDTIIDCIGSIIHQSRDFALEIILSDDGSTDRTVEIACTTFPEIKALLKPAGCEVQGAAGARNRGLDAASYEYICFLDSDDYYLPGFLEKSFNFLEANKNYGYVFCRSKMQLFENGELTLQSWTRERLTYLDRQYHVLYRPFNINTNTIMVRSDIIFYNELRFDILLKNGNDTDMWLKLSEVSAGKFLDFFGTVYRLNHSKNQLTGNSSKIKELSRIRIYSTALQRYLERGDEDRLRLLLIVRILLYLKRPARGKYSILMSHFFVCAKLFYLFPIASVRFFWLINKR